MNSIEFSISHDKNFSFSECHWYLDRNHNECLYSIEGNSVRKALMIREVPVIVHITGNDQALQVKIFADNVTPEMEAEVRNYIIDWFDLKRDISPFYQLLKKHDRLAYMASEYAGLRLIGIPDLFEAISWCIIGQQINLTFAHKVKRRLVEKYGEKVEYDNNVYYLFPRYEIIADASIEELRAMQFSNRKAEYLITAARAFSTGEISKEKLLRLTDPDSQRKALTNLKGIGVWTANYALMKCLRVPTSIPYGDAGLLNALMRHNIIQQKNDLEAIEKFFEQFPGWQSYLVFYLWHSLSDKIDSNPTY